MLLFHYLALNIQRNSTPMAPGLLWYRYPASIKASCTCSMVTVAPGSMDLMASNTSRVENQWVATPAFDAGLYVADRAATYTLISVGLSFLGFFSSTFPSFPANIVV